MDCLISLLTSVFLILVPSRPYSQHSKIEIKKTSSHIYILDKIYSIKNGVIRHNKDVLRVHLIYYTWVFITIFIICIHLYLIKILYLTMLYILLNLCILQHQAYTVFPWHFKLNILSIFIVLFPKTMKYPYGYFKLPL